MRPGIDVDALCKTDDEIRFLNLFKEYVTRDGWQRLLCILRLDTNFFIAPASTCHHNAYEGGLLQHSLHVCTRLLQLRDTIDLSAESCVICALLHDVCKADQYQMAKKWQKDESGQWKEKLVYVFKDEFPAGHGEKSVMMILPYMQLTEDEQLAIRWHMGRWDSAANDYIGLQTLAAAQRISPLVTALHLADQMATWFDETSYE